jgi:ribosome maturation factor RimP
VKNSETLIAEMITPTVNALGLELWGVEQITQGKFSILRVYIENEQGITVDDCAQVSRQISSLLDVEDPIPGEYTLEVSSPGLDRPLFYLEQYEQHIGNEVNLRLRTPLAGRRKFKGRIVEIKEGSVCLEVDGEEFVLPYSDIDKTNVAIE